MHYLYAYISQSLLGGFDSTALTLPPSDCPKQTAHRLVQPTDWYSKGNPPRLVAMRVLSQAGGCIRAGSLIGWCR